MGHLFSQAYSIDSGKPSSIIQCIMPSINKDSIKIGLVSLGVIALAIAAGYIMYNYFSAGFTPEIDEEQLGTPEVIEPSEEEQEADDAPRPFVVNPDDSSGISPLGTPTPQAQGPSGVLGDQSAPRPSEYTGTGISPLGTGDPEAPKGLAK